MFHRFQIGLRTLVAKTCVCCGVLKMASEFPLEKAGYRNSYCQGCHNNQSREVVYTHQYDALKHARRNREPWTEGDLRLLEEMAAEGLTGAQMAKRLRRTLYAVYTMKNRMMKENA